MKKALTLIITFLSFLFLISLHEGVVFASERTGSSSIAGNAGTGNIDSGSGEDTEDSEKYASGETIDKEYEDPDISQEEEAKVKKDLNEFIIESYKAQGTKILKELDIKLQKSLPETSERIEAYKKILSSLELREKRLERMKTSQTKKIILKGFLDHMINSLKKKIESLEK